jgi:ABC-type cobalamin transport system permease subunit
MMTELAEQASDGLLVDWQAVFRAAMIAGTVFLLLNLFVVPALMGSSFWISVRLTASMVLGQEVLAPPATFNGLALAAAVVVHYALALLMTAIIAVVVHLGGLAMGILGGAALGLAFYYIDYYSLTYFFPQFFAMKDGSVIASHVIFGALAGGLYEWLESDWYEEAQGENGGV